MQHQQGVRDSENGCVCVFLCLCVCVCERERKNASDVLVCHKNNVLNTVLYTIHVYI
jgi:hypothetical protein